MNQLIKSEYKEKWQTLFKKFEKLGDLDKPLTEKILSDPEHCIT